MQIRWLFRLTYLYLLIPFILFCLGWLRLIFALPLIALLTWIFIQLDRSAQPDQVTNYESRVTYYALLITGIWVLLSGVGGYAFQNWDHHWRNAVFRDLINYDFPVIYSSPARGPVKALVYYMGYWLPSALAGKLFGWSAANLFLFLWTWLGAALTAAHISLKIKTSALKASLLLVFFSGMDALGVALRPSDYPTLFPPVQHLEVWADKLQYSSFTTQLFWTFNQAVPAWLCIMLVLSSKKIHIKILAWSLCFFFAPLISVGLLPYLLIELSRDLKNVFKSLRFDALLASTAIAAVSYLYFSSNAAAQQRGFQTLAIKDVLMFFLLEGGILWLVLAPRLWRDPRWALTGILLFAAPFIRIGSGGDFAMRASIAPLFYLMLAGGEALFQTAPPRALRAALCVILVIGALTPMYEMNRSAYRTYQYYFVLDETRRAQPTSEPITHLEQAGALESIHPDTLVADDVKTLQFMSDELSKNFIANVRQSLYYRYLSPR
ncbi:MAG: hypothetical protein PHQ36_00205 [Anaerolineales bacterium]|nr:hypothetical protein [Anaerolineales bacterium]